MPPKVEPAAKPGAAPGAEPAKPGAAEPGAETSATPGATPGAAAPAAKADSCKNTVKDEDDKCPPSKPNLVEDFRAGVNKKVDGVGKSLHKMFVNPVECINNYAGSAPNLISGMVNSIGNSISDSFNKIADSIGHLTDETINMNIVNPFTYAKNQFVKKFQDVFNQMLLGDGWERLMNTEKDPSRIAAVIEERSFLMKSAFDNIEFRGGFTKWINNYLDALTATLEIGRPKIDALKKEVNDTIEGLGTDVGTTIGHSITNAIVTTLSVLPGIGTAVNAINSASKISEELIKTCGEPIAKIGGISKKISKTVKHQTDILDCEIKKVTKLFDNVGKPKVGGGTSGGGTSGTRKNVQKNIQKTTKRVNYMLKQFACKKKKINYTQRLRRF